MSEDTQGDKKESDAMLQEMLNNIETAPEPGELVKNPVVHAGTDELPVPMIGKVVGSAGYAYIYDTRTGDRSRANRNMLPALLKIRRDDGSRTFTTIKPAFSPKRGTFKCLLHKDSKNREKYDEMALPVCSADALSNRHQMMRHMQKKHPAEWEAIENNRMELEREEDRELKRALLDKATGAEGLLTAAAVMGTPEAPLYVSGKKKKK